MTRGWIISLSRVYRKVSDEVRAAILRGKRHFGKSACVCCSSGGQSTSCAGAAWCMRGSPGLPGVRLSPASLFYRGNKVHILTLHKTTPVANRRAAQRGGCPGRLRATLLPRPCRSEQVLPRSPRKPRCLKT